MDITSIEKFIDHTNLKPDAREEAVRKLCQEARQYGFYSVCVNGCWVSFCVDQLAGTEVKTAAVVGFPLGASSAVSKAYEAAQAVKDGAAEIDMVLNIGWLLDGKYDLVRNDIQAVVDAVSLETKVKVILETGYLSAEHIKTACKLAEEAGAHFVKTSTGFGPGGALTEHVALMRESVSPSVGVKASGGIRDYETAVRMIRAGANRIGTSSGVAIVTGAGGAGGASGTY